MDNVLDPNLMSTAERLAEIGEILAAGLIRRRAKQCQTDDNRDYSLDFPAHRSRHGRKPKRRERP